VSSAALDRLLALLLAAQITTGLVSLRAGAPATAPLFWVHGLLGGALLVAVAMKLRRSVGPAVRQRRWRRIALGGLLAMMAAGALLGGVAWVASGRILTIGPWTVLTIHVLFALALLPVAAIHLLPHRWRLLRPPARSGLSRRAFLAAAGVLAVGAVAWSAANLLDVVQGGVRRFTGSRWLPAGGVPPPTTFFGEATEQIDPAAWRLTVTGRVTRPMTLSLAELEALGTTERREVLDCTSGWALATDWRGVSLGTLLDAAEPSERARSVTVRAVTGWYATLGIREAHGALLATHVAGQPLPHGNGAPCRLVAPGRRGLEWVKWVTQVEVA